MRKFSIVSVACYLMTVIACSKGSSGDVPVNAPAPPGTTGNCSTTPAKFSIDVRPIIQNSCAIGSGCHGAGSGNGPGPLLTFDQIRNAASAIRGAVVSRVMPKGGSLTNTQIQSIACWVDNNAPND